MAESGGRISPLHSPEGARRGECLPPVDRSWGRDPSGRRVCVYHGGRCGSQGPPHTCEPPWPPVRHLDATVVTRPGIKVVTRSATRVTPASPISSTWLSTRSAPQARERNTGARRQTSVGRLQPDADIWGAPRGMHPPYRSLVNVGEGHFLRKSAPPPVDEAEKAPLRRRGWEVCPSPVDRATPSEGPFLRARKKVEVGHERKRPLPGCIPVKCSRPGTRRPPSRAVDGGGAHFRGCEVCTPPVDRAAPSEGHFLRKFGSAAPTLTILRSEGGRNLGSLPPPPSTGG